MNQKDIQRMSQFKDNESICSGNENSIIKHQTEIVVHGTVKAIILSHSF